MAKPPLVTVKERFESKKKLVDAVEKLASSELWIDRVSSAKGLGRISNAKLLRLHAVLSDAKQRFGSRGKLVTAILDLAKRSKDEGYASRLDRYPLPQLLDLHRSLTQEEKRAKTKPAPVPKAKAEKAIKAGKAESAAKPAEAKAAEAKATPKKSSPKADKPEKAPAKKAAKKV
jgi:hypothetical protein